MDTVQHSGIHCLSQLLPSVPMTDQPKVRDNNVQTRIIFELVRLDHVITNYILDSLYLVAIGRYCNAWH